MVYKISLPLVGSTGTRKKEIIDGDNNLVIDEIRVGSFVQISSFPGSTSGYTSGGNTATTGSTVTNTIDKFPFSTNANATDVGDLTQSRMNLSGQSSSENGYTSGGETAAGPTGTRLNTIDKFPFSSDTNATDVGDLTLNVSSHTGHSSSENGYTSGGNAPLQVNTIDNFPFSSDANATDVGDLTQARQGHSSSSSLDNGYAAGGWSPGFVNVIDKFSFSTNANATDVGDLTVARGDIHSGQSSTENGYTSGGLIGPPLVTQNVIDKFSFASDANATDVGNTTAAKQDAAGQSSIDNGYSSGGGTGNAPAPILNIIENFPFSSDANATDVGDLTASRRDTTGQQV